MSAIFAVSYSLLFLLLLRVNRRSLTKGKAWRIYRWWIILIIPLLRYGCLYSMCRQENTNIIFSLLSGKEANGAAFQGYLCYGWHGTDFSLPRKIHARKGISMCIIFHPWNNEDTPHMQPPLWSFLLEDLGGGDLCSAMLSPSLSWYFHFLPVTVPVSATTIKFAAYFYSNGLFISIKILLL